MAAKEQPTGKPGRESAKQPARVQSIEANLVGCGQPVAMSQTAMTMPSTHSEFYILDKHLQPYRHDHQNQLLDKLSVIDHWTK